MTKRDYVLIAEALGDGYKSAFLQKADRQHTFTLIVQQMAAWLSADNPRFDPVRFKQYVKGVIEYKGLRTRTL